MPSQSSLDLSLALEKLNFVAAVLTHPMGQDMSGMCLTDQDLTA